MYKSCNYLEETFDKLKLVGNGHVSLNQSQHEADDYQGPRVYERIMRLVYRIPTLYKYNKSYNWSLTWRQLGYIYIHFSVHPYALVIKYDDLCSGMMVTI